MYYSVDRFEEAFAVLVDENGTSVIIERLELPTDTQVGDMLCKQGNAYVRDTEETTARREKLYRLEQLLRGQKR